MWRWLYLAWFIGFAMGGLVMQHLYLAALKYESNKHKTQAGKDNFDIYELLLNQEDSDVDKTVKSLNKLTENKIEFEKKW